MLGAAKIAPNGLIKPCENNSSATVLTLAARDRSRAEAMARRYSIPQVMDSYQEVIEHPECDATYIALPISAHYDWTLAALRAGKHVLCEKTLACNTAEAEEMAAVAREMGLVLMEAFHYRYHPMFIRAKTLIASGAVGMVREIEAELSFPAGIPADDIRMQYATGGGVTMDIGCYPISWVRHLLDAEPEEVSAVALEGPPDVDITLTTEMKFANGVVARTKGDMNAEPDGTTVMIKVHGDRGTLEVTNPLVPQKGHDLALTVDGGETTHETTSLRPTYEYQLDAFVAAVKDGAPLDTDGEDAVKQLRVIDRAYRSAGMRLRDRRATQEQT